MQVVKNEIRDRVQEYIQRYAPETQLPQRSLVPFPSDDEIISTPQRMYSFSRGGDPRYKRYLETIGLGMCIGLTVYDPQTKVGCIAHLDNDRGIKPPDETFELPFLLNVAHQFQHYQSHGPYQVRIVGGWTGLSEETLLPLFETLHYLAPFEIVQLSVLQPMPWGFQSNSLDIILDLDDGMLYNSSIGERNFDKLIRMMGLIQLDDPTGIYWRHEDPKGL